MEPEQTSSNTPLIMIGVISTLVVVGLLIALNKPQLQQASTAHHRAELLGVLTAIKHINEQLLPKDAATGKTDVLIEGVAIPLLNGRLRATEGSLKRGLDVAYRSIQTEHTPFDYWNMLGRPSNANEPMQIQLQHKDAPEGCHIIYIEAGTIEIPKDEQYVLVDKGC